MSNIIKDTYQRPMHWEIQDTLFDLEGKVIANYNHVNVVVNDCSKLIASLMKGQAGQAGVKYWAVGKGNASWNNDAIPNPTVNDTKLLQESFRKAITPEDITFIDDSNNPTETITSKLQIKVTFLENEANGDLREFGLFGGNATGVANSGLMINRKTHPLIYKTSGMRLERIIRLAF